MRAVNPPGSIVVGYVVLRYVLHFLKEREMAASTLICRVEPPFSVFSGKVSAYYFAKEDFTTNNSKCICIRKGEVGQLLEIQSSGWWKMSVEGVLGWTPGEFWESLQVI